MIELDIQLDELAEVQTYRNKSIKFVALGIAVSVFLHVVLLVWFAGIYSAFRSAAKGSDSVTYEITLNTLAAQKPEASSEPVVPASPQPLPPLPLQTEEVVQTAPPDPPPIVEEVHNPIHNADEPGSRNNSEKREGKLVTGKPATGEPAPSESIHENIKEKAKVKTDAIVSELVAIEEEISLKDLTEAKEQKKVEIDSTKLVTKPEEKVVPKIAAQSNESFQVEKKVVEESARQEVPVEAKSAVKHEPKKITATPSAGGTTKMEIPKEFLEKLGNIDLMDESGLLSTRIEEPFSEIEARRIRLMNVYLAKMQKQVGLFWRKPAKEMPLAKGVIKFELDPEGYLINAYIYRGSGNVDLDVSALDAVRSVARYSVPESRAVAARYYRHLSFHYSSRDSNVEDAPWEVPKKQ